MSPPSDGDLRVANGSTHSASPARLPRKQALQGLGTGSQDSMDCSHSVSTERKIAVSDTFLPF